MSYFPSWWIVDENINNLYFEHKKYKIMNKANYENIFQSNLFQSVDDVIKLRCYKYQYVYKSKEDIIDIFKDKYKKYNDLIIKLANFCEHKLIPYFNSKNENIINYSNIFIQDLNEICNKHKSNIFFEDNKKKKEILQEFIKSIPQSQLYMKVNYYLGDSFSNNVLEKEIKIIDFFNISILPNNKLLIIDNNKQIR